MNLVPVLPYITQYYLHYLHISCITVTVTFIYTALLGNT